MHQRNCRANHIHSTKNCVKESPSPRDVLLGFFSEEERWKIWFLPMQLTATKRKPIYMLQQSLDSVGVVSNDKPWPTTFQRCDKVLNDLPPRWGLWALLFLHPCQNNLHFTLKTSGQKLRFDAWHLQYIKDNWQDWYIVNENINKCRNCQVVDSDYSGL